MENTNHKLIGLDDLATINNYLYLSDKRYLELKRRDAVLADWLKAIADKTGVPIDLSQLEKTNN